MSTTHLKSFAASLFALGMYLTAKNAQNKQIYRISLLAIILSVLLITAFATAPKESHFVFLFEAGSWLVWQFWILWITFYGFKKNS